MEKPAARTGQENNAENCSPENKSLKTKHEENDEEEDDVPGDFFEDFLKEDFMAGLDIVDEDDEDADEKVKKDNTKRTQSDNHSTSRKRELNVSDATHQSNKNGNKKATQKMKHDKELKRLDKELEEMRNAKVKRPRKPKTNIDADDFDIRRDPEKTRRDIQKYKDKCEKDKEKKILDEKLGLVETGLVPPGMELEVDLEEIKRKDLKASHETFDLRQRLQSKRSGSSKKESPKREREMKRKRTPSPVHRPTSKEPSRKKEAEKSPNRRSPRMVGRRASDESRVFRRESDRSTRQRSPLRRDYKKELSPRRSVIPRRSPVSPFPRSRFRRSRSHERSPRRRSRSPRMRRRDSSFSPIPRHRRSRSPVRTMKREEKRSFLEELVEKLNETSRYPEVCNPLPQPQPQPQPVPYMMPIVAPVPAPAPVPIPVPAPAPPPRPVQQSFFQPTNSYDPYDQSFFIGNRNPLPAKPDITNFNTTASNQLPSSKIISPQTSLVSTSSHARLNVPPNLPGSKGEVSKLFQDKKIRLTDFLAITARPEANQPTTEHLKEKIKVLQRCQDAIQFLEFPEKKFTGRLVVKNLDINEPPENKFVSPLLRYPEVKLPFTTPDEEADSEKRYGKFCRTLLQTLGINKDISVTQKDIACVRTSPKKVPSPTAPLVSPSPRINKTNSILHKQVQTEARLNACSECAARNAIEYLSLGIQCGAPALSFSVSTQVTEADFYEMIPNTQSLSTLTPAQLLGKTSQSKPTQSSGSLVQSLESFLSRTSATRAGDFISPPYNPLSDPTVGPSRPPIPPSLLSLRPQNPFLNNLPNQYGNFNNRY